MLSGVKESAVKSKPKKNINDQAITIGVNYRLTLQQIKQFVSKTIPANLSRDSYAAMKVTHQFLKSCVEQHIPIYGLNTHFGDQVNFLDRYLNTKNQALYLQSVNDRQMNLIKSHSCGLGNVIPAEVVRIAMLLRAHCLSQGYSGVRPSVVEAMLSYLNAGIVPIVRCYGSIGASGDLIPLAMIAAGLIGENVDVLYKDKIIKAPQALKLAGLKPFVPELRDGLAMINGTSFMTAVTSVALCNLKRLFKQMLAAIAMSLESMKVISSAFHPLVHQLKRQLGEQLVNDFLLDFWKDSHLLSDLDQLRSHNVAHNESARLARKVKALQDYYSLRAVSQGFGPMYENLDNATTWIENEMNAVNDNPIIDAQHKQIHHNANFMGYYVTDACDILKMNIAQASTWLHALLANMVHPRKSHHLPANLVKDPGHANGFRPIQLLAAALAVQNRKLAQSQQAYMLPTEGDNQDVNSLGMHAALDFQESVVNLERLTAILLLAATQALELRGIKKASKRAQTIYSIIRQHSAFVDCRPMSEEMSTIIGLLKKEII